MYQELEYHNLTSCNLNNVFPLQVHVVPVPTFPEFPFFEHKYNLPLFWNFCEYYMYSMFQDSYFFKLLIKNTMT